MPNNRFCKHEDYIKRRYEEFHRSGTSTETATLLMSLQPVPAIIGLVGSLAISLVFTTATWWHTKVNVRKVAVALGAVSIACPYVFSDISS